MGSRVGGMSPRYRIFRRSMLAGGKLLFGFTIEGEERVPQSGPLVVAANHWRFFDPVFVCMAVPRRVQWMAKKELFIAPLRRLFRFMGAFPVDRSGGARAAIRTAITFLKDGWALGIFPEGTRRRARGAGNDDGDGGGAKSGAVMLAVRGGAPIVPVFVGPVPNPVARLRGERMVARIGEPIVLDGSLRGRDAYAEAADRVLREIYALRDEGARAS
jgi:1-acyl-sn-glycerol-3-phosphate acyltransferase